MARIVSLLAWGAAVAASRSSRGAAVAASRSYRTASRAASRSCRAAPTAAGDVAGGSCPIARRDLSDDVSGKGGAPRLPAIRSGDYPVDPPPNHYMGSPYELEMRWAAMMRKAKACLKVDEKVLESDEALWALYERWCNFYEIERDHDEMARRFNRFKQNVQHVYEVNNSDVPFNLGLNQFADQDLDELFSPAMYDTPI